MFSPQAAAADSEASFTGESLLQDLDTIRPFD